MVYGPAELLSGWRGLGSDVVRASRYSLRSSLEGLPPSYLSGPCLAGAGERGNGMDEEWDR